MTRSAKPLQSEPQQARCACLFLSLLFTLAGCGGGSGTPASGGVDQGSTPAPNPDATYLRAPAEGIREWLTFDEMTSAGYRQDGPVHTAYFMPVNEQARALHEFEGTIRLSQRNFYGSILDSWHGDQGFLSFPDISMRFVSHEGILVPLDRGILHKEFDGSYWRVILSPGTVWSESSDNGWSRASFPFVLVHKQRNEAHNGLATFLYRADEMSLLRFEVIQETTPWAINNFWGHLEANYEPESFAETKQARTAFSREIATRLVVHPWSELESQFGSSALSRFTGSLQESQISMTGLVIDEEVYLKTCGTRYGDYPYCQEMRQGAFSVTKSLGNALAALRLAQKYGEWVFDVRIANTLDVSADHGGWEDVTIGDALSMTTGIGNNGGRRGSGDIFADENEAPMEGFQNSNSARQMLDAAFGYNNYDWGPGEVFRYNSTHHFVAAAAMDAFYKSMEGADAELWAMVQREVLQPIGIQHSPTIHSIEAGGSQGIPVGYVGLYPTVDDLAKISSLYQNHGMHQGVQLLHAGKTAEALFQTTNIGLHSWWADNRWGNSRYLYSFWTEPYGDGCDLQIPYMSGFGGNTVALLPNGVTAFRFADADDYSATDLVRVAANIRSPCL